LKFKGVGRKTANLVVTVGYGKDGICVDTHVHRITNRWGYLRTKTPTQTEFALREILPRPHWRGINGLLVSFGQGICRPVSPLCNMCLIRQHCEFGRTASGGGLKGNAVDLSIKMSEPRFEGLRDYGAFRLRAIQKKGGRLRPLLDLPYKGTSPLDPIKNAMYFVFNQIETRYIRIMLRKLRAFFSCKSFNLCNPGSDSPLCFLKSTALGLKGCFPSSCALCVR
ncbi:MAG: hypothetical protein HQL04_06080, partial [Nitrospirae bacterium]|nr:hypothetical protein [Nitrospirota bacterium]